MSLVRNLVWEDVEFANCFPFHMCHTVASYLSYVPPGLAISKHMP